MNEESVPGISRREIIKRSAVIGGVVWVAPTVLASPASGAVTPMVQCSSCPAGTLFGIKHNTNSGCEAPGGNPNGAGNCAARFGVTGFASGCCLETAGLVTFTESANNQTHTYLLANGVAMCAAFAKCGPTCHSHLDAQVTGTANPDGTFTVTMSCPSLSHSEIVVCVRGTGVPAGCT